MTYFCHWYTACGVFIFELRMCQFSIPQIEYPLGGSSKKGSHVYFLLQVFWVLLLFDINVDLMLPWWPDITIVQSDVTIVGDYDRRMFKSLNPVCWYAISYEDQEKLCWYCIYFFNSSCVRYQLWSFKIGFTSALPRSSQYKISFLVVTLLLSHNDWVSVSIKLTRSSLKYFMNNICISL